MSIITQSTQVPHPDDRLARWYSLRQAYLNADEVGHEYWPELTSKVGWAQRFQASRDAAVGGKRAVG